MFVVAGGSDRSASKEAIRPSRASRGEHKPVSFFRDLLDRNRRSSVNDTCGKAVSSSRQRPPIRGWYFASTVSLRGFLKQTVLTDAHGAAKSEAMEQHSPKALRSLFENAPMFGAAYISTARI